MDALERIACHNFVVVDGYAYFSSWFYNGLFKVEILTGRTTFLGYFEGEKLSQGNIHWELLLKNGRIYFLPKMGRHMHIYKLSDRSMERVEIRSDSEKAFVAGEVILGEDFFAFIPIEKNYPVRKVDLETFAVTNISEQIIIQGERRFQYKTEDSYPASMLMEDYHIERADRASWKRLSDGSWYGFLPMGRRLLRYSEETRELYSMPLTVVNDEELEKHLHKVRQSLLGSVLGEDTMGLQMFLDEIVRGEIHGADGLGHGKNIGKEIWEHISDRTDG